MYGIFPIIPHAWALQEPTAEEKQLVAERLEQPMDVEWHEREIRDLVRPRLVPCEQPRTSGESTVFLIDFGEGQRWYCLRDGLTQDEQSETKDGIWVLASFEAFYLPSAAIFGRPAPQF